VNCALRYSSAVSARPEWIVPDTLVSPGGVIAVSHELSPPWDSEAVNDDAYRMVQQSVRTLFDWSRKAGGLNSVSVYQTFEKMIDAEWQ